MKIAILLNKYNKERTVFTMNIEPLRYTHEQLINLARISNADIMRINQCRRPHNRLGFAYQLSFVRLANRFPSQDSFEVVDEVLNYVSVQIGIPSKAINAYAQRRQTVDEHREHIREYLGLNRFGEADGGTVRRFVFQEACRLETLTAILTKTEQFLRDQRILRPSDDTLRRLIGNQREEAKRSIFKKIAGSLSKDVSGMLDALLTTEDIHYSPFQALKQPPGRPSPAAMLKLIEGLEKIQTTGVLDVDLFWLNNNFQRSLARYAKQSTAARLRELEPVHRCAVLVCFLLQGYLDTVDFLVDMYDKLINRIYNPAQADVDNHHKAQRKGIRESLSTFRDLVELILDDTVEDAILRKELFRRIGKNELTNKIAEVNVWLTGKYSHVFNLVKQRFSYIRQFSPALIKHLQLISEGNGNSPLLNAVDILRKMNDQNKRKLSDDVPLDFIPKKIRPLVEVNGTVNKAAWECALLTAIRDEIKAGNLSVKMSKRFGRIDGFFIPCPI